jgi:hypothetical protein
MDMTGAAPVTTQFVINALLTIAGFAATWWINVMWGMMKAQQQAIHELNVKLAEHYAPRAEFEQKLNRLFELLESIRREIRESRG